jgi:hypothetical protein
MDQDGFLPADDSEPWSEDTKAFMKMLDESLMAKKLTSK